MNNRRKQLMLASAKEYCKCVVEGKTLKYNQLANIVNKQAEVIQGLTISTTNGLIKINGTSTTDNTYFDYQIAEYSYNGFKANHKYFIWLQQSNYGRVFLVASSPYNKINDSPIIFACTSSQYLILRVATNGLTYNNYCVRVNVIDLTALGLDSITSPGDFFATDLGKYIAKGNYLPYEPNGKFIHAQSPIHFKGVNIWNENCKNGIYYEGNFYSNGYEDFICSVDMIKVSPNKEYFYFNGSSDFDCYIVYEMFDKNRNYISRNICENKHSFRTTNDCEYVLFYVNNTYGNKYNHDICISENVYDINRTQGILSGSSASTPRAFEEGKYYIGLSGNNYYYPNYISSFSYDGLTMSFQTSSGGYGVVLPFKVEGNKTYYLDYVSNPNESVVYVSYFDKNGNYINYVSTSNHLVTTPANCYWLVLVLRPQTNILATYRNIVVKEIGYQRYCGTKTYYEPLTYNQLVQNGNFASTENWSLNGCTLSVLNNVGTLTITENNASNGIETGIQLGGSSHKYALVYKAYASRTTKVWFRLGGSSIAGIEEYIYTTERQFKFIFTSSYNSTETLRMFVNINNLFLQNGDKVYLSNFMVIDLTNLYGAGNEPTTVNELNETDLGKAIDNSEYLPYSVSNNAYYVGGWDMYKGCVWKSWNGQLTKTMSLINLDNLSWTAEDFGMVAQLPSNFKTFEGTELASVIAEKYETAKYYDEIQDSICIADVHPYGYSVVIRYGNTTPSGFALFELATPTTKNVTTRMVSRRTINVESDNGIDMDFTKE